MRPAGWLTRGLLSAEIPLLGFAAQSCVSSKRIRLLRRVFLVFIAMPFPYTRYQLSQRNSDADTFNLST